MSSVMWPTTMSTIGYGLRLSIVGQQIACTLKFNLQFVIVRFSRGTRYHAKKRLACCSMNSMRQQENHRRGNQKATNLLVNT